MRLLPTLLLACAGAANATPLDRLAWLAGCWAQEGREPGSVEQWMPAAGGLMLGMARTLKGGRAVDFEFMQIRQAADGGLSFVAQPRGSPPTAFALVSQQDDEVRFENPGHDFPQRVIYRLAAPDRLAARIEGQVNGQPRGMDFPMRRTPCP